MSPADEVSCVTQNIRQEAMKVIILAALLLSSGIGNNLNFISQNDAEEKSKLELCLIYSRASQMIMQNRQDDVPIEMMISVTEQEAKMPALKDVLILTIRIAYKQPIALTPEAKKEVSIAFATKQLEMCQKALNKED